ncbi:MAG: hypothetical protein JRH07_07285 [Deltaproteobacteria bacterium]|nr:hypothetical protein [Deltaproteobacteria bacterium]
MNVANTPEVIVREMPEVTVTGNVNVVNSPEVRIADVSQVEVVNGAGSSIPVRITNPMPLRAHGDTTDFFSWHRRSFVDSQNMTRNHSAISVSKMQGRPFVLTDLVVTTRFKDPKTELILSLKGAGADRGLGLDFILVPEAPHLVSHLQTGIVFSPEVAMNVSVSVKGEGGDFRVDYTVTFSGYFLARG